MSQCSDTVICLLCSSNFWGDDILFYFFFGHLNTRKILENTRRAFQKIERVTSIFMRKTLRSIIFERQPLFTASGQVFQVSSKGKIGPITTLRASISLQVHLNISRVKQDLARRGKQRGWCFHPRVLGLGGRKSCWKIFRKKFLFYFSPLFYHLLS